MSLGILKKVTFEEVTYFTGKASQSLMKRLKYVLKTHHEEHLKIKMK